MRRERAAGLRDLFVVTAKTHAAHRRHQPRASRPPITATQRGPWTACSHRAAAGTSTATWTSRSDRPPAGRLRGLHRIQSVCASPRRPTLRSGSGPGIADKWTASRVGVLLSAGGGLGRWVFRIDRHAQTVRRWGTYAHRAPIAPAGLCHRPHPPATHACPRRPPARLTLTRAPQPPWLSIVGRNAASIELRCPQAQTARR